MGSKLGRPVGNKHHVPKKTWNKWSNEAKRVFNRLMHEMRPTMQWAFLHPDAAPALREHWLTTRWNAAYSAAYIVDKDYCTRVLALKKDTRIRKLTKRLNRGN